MGASTTVLPDAGNAAPVTFQHVVLKVPLGIMTLSPPFATVTPDVDELKKLKEKSGGRAIGGAVVDDVKVPSKVVPPSVDRKNQQDICPPTPGVIADPGVNQTEPMIADPVSVWLHLPFE